MNGELWLFLGDSLTEGIGDRRGNYPEQVAAALRSVHRGPVHSVRLRQLDLSTHRDLSHFNVAGHVDFDPSRTGEAIWIMNLAAEATTVEADAGRAEQLAQLRPARVFVLRGPLETVPRPAPTQSGEWPRWTPRSWRGYAALDPRCHFSAVWWRRAKQRAIDWVKQSLRRRLLRSGGAPLMSTQAFLAAYDRLLAALAESGAALVVLALPPIDDAVFPGASRLVEERNSALAALARSRGAAFLDWAGALDAHTPSRFCRDGLHPNDDGARAMARMIVDHVRVQPA